MSSGFAEKLRQTLKRNLSQARAQSDRLFQIVAQSAMYDRPIAERHRTIFYLGHLEAFDGNMICHASFELPPFHPEFDRMFAFGIDPVNGHLPDDSPSDWPSMEEVLSYNARVRQRVDECLQRATLVNSQNPYVENGQIFWAIIEHRLMHAETLAYMFHWLPAGLKHGPTGARGVRAVPPAPRQVHIPSGEATLGFRPGGPFSFGWDNEFDRHSVAVPEFLVDAYNVTNQQYLEFLNAGGYQERSLWSDDAWKWIRSSDVKHPRFWMETGNGWLYKAMFEDIPLPPYLARLRQPCGGLRVCAVGRKIAADRTAVSQGRFWCARRIGTPFSVGGLVA